MTGGAIITPELADAAIYRALSLFMGDGRKFSVEDVAIGTSIPARTLYGFVASGPEDRRRPKGWHLLTLQQFFGVAFTDKLLSPIGQGGRSLEAEEGSPGVVMAHLTRDLAQIAGCGVNGAWNHTHERQLEKAADDAILILTPLSSLGHAK